MPDLLDKTQTTSVSQSDTAVYVVNNRTTTPVDRWMTPGDFHKSRTGNDSVLAFASLSAAITAIGSTEATIEIPATTVVSASLTSPTNVTLLWTGPGQISVASGQTLTINGPIQAPIRQIFAGLGTVKFGGRIGVSFPEWFGAVGDNATDDQAAIQKAIDAFKDTGVQHHPGLIHLISGYAIGSTVTISGNSVKLVGAGWGVQNDDPYRGFIRWIGSAGSPMVLVTECWNTTIENLRIIGKSTAKPSAGIELRSQNISHGLDSTFIRNVYIGHMFGYDADSSAHQLAVGILISGTVDGDTNRFENCYIVGCDTGVDIQNPNAGVTMYDNFLFSLCSIGFKCNSPVMGTNWNFGACDLDIELVNLIGRLNLRDVTSEGAGTFALMGAGTSLRIDDLGFQISNSLNVSGVIIDGDTSNANLVLRNALFQTTGDYSGVTPTLLVRNTGAGSQNHIRLENVRGLTATNLDVQTVGGGFGDIREIFFHRPPNDPGGYDYGVNDHVVLTNSEAYEEGRWDFLSKVNVFGGPLKVAQLPTPTGLALNAVGGTGTTRGYRVSAISGSGQTLACSTVTVSGPTTLDSTHYIELTWLPVRGADGYKVYGRTSGSELLMATVRPSDGTQAVSGQTTSFKDDGSVTPSGALPTINTTGQMQQPDGSAGAPSYSFASDTTAGIDRGSGYSAVAQGGSELLRVYDNGHIVNVFGGFLFNASQDAGLQRDIAKFIRPNDGSSGGAGGLTLDEMSANPANPTQDTQLHIYVKADKLVFQFNNGGTIRYFTLDLTQSGATATWAQSTSAP